MNLDEEFEIIKEFAKENANMFPDGGKVLSYRLKKAKYLSNEHLQKIKNNFIDSRTFNNKEISTVPDVSVYSYIKKKYDKTDEEINAIKESHNICMSVEDLIGHTLEEYIYSVTNKDGWIWCSGNILRSIDFIKKEINGEQIVWKMLQIKNSDNSENSSSKNVRKGTPIKMWFRRFSKKYAYNWEELHVLMGSTDLSEENFLKFLDNKA